MRTDSSVCQKPRKATAVKISLNDDFVKMTDNEKTFLYHSYTIFIPRWLTLSRNFLLFISQPSVERKLRTKTSAWKVNVSGKPQNQKHSIPSALFSTLLRQFSYNRCSLLNEVASSSKNRWRLSLKFKSDPIQKPGLSATCSQRRVQYVPASCSFVNL